MHGDLEVYAQCLRRLSAFVLAVHPASIALHVRDSPCDIDTQSEASWPG